MKGTGFGGAGLRGLALFLLALAIPTLISPPPAESQSLRGSPASLDRQNEQARAHDFTYLETAADVRRFVEAGYLVPVRSGDNYEVLSSVSFPYARPEARLFIRRLAAQYRAACGERLVVTSLTRPRNRQPPNASSRSVHPTGMAIDLRVSSNAQCRSWLESTLLSLEGQGVLEAIRERRPPHYHVVVFPRPYANHVAQVTGQDAAVLASAGGEGEVTLEYVEHRVRPGENLTRIARRYDTSPSRIQAENNLSSARILAGQTLRIPAYREGGETGGEVRTAAAEPMEHTVGRGESLWTLARRYDTSVQAIRRANGLSSDRIRAGENLVIPGTAESGATVVEYEVRSGESLWGIARQHGTTVEQLRSKNGISPSSRIQPGQVLAVPLDGL